jgi:hypothetical protein
MNVDLFAFVKTLPDGIQMAKCGYLSTFFHINFYQGKENGWKKSFSFLFCVRARAQKKSDFFILEKPFFMQANPVFIMQTLCVCAGSKQILFF